MRFGAARAGLDVEEGIIGVEFAGEHAAEFEVFDVFFVGIDVGDGGVDGGFVVFGFGEFDEVKGVLQPLFDGIQSLDDADEGGAFLTEFGGFFGVIPDAGTFEFAFDFFEAFGFYGVVKDTP